MSASRQSTFTLEELLADLEKDGIRVDTAKKKKAKKGKNHAMVAIGLEYYNQKRNYVKAMAWYRLAATNYDDWAQYYIGELYAKGHGVPRDYLIAMNWYLKSALQNNKKSWESIGEFFEQGTGVTVDKYKALEWYYRCGTKPDKLKALMDQGIKLSEQDRIKPFKRLLLETADVFWEINQKMVKEVKEKNKQLQKDNRALKVMAECKKAESNVQGESTNQNKSNIQIMNSDLELLKKSMNGLEMDLETQDDKVAFLENEIMLLYLQSF